MKLFLYVTNSLGMFHLSGCEMIFSCSGHSFSHVWASVEGNIQNKKTRFTSTGYVRKTMQTANLK